MTPRFLRRLLAPALLAATAGLVGCAKDATQTPPPSGSRADAVPAQSTVPTAASGNTGQLTPANPGVSLRETTVAGFETAVQAHRGKVVLIDVWFYG